MFRKLTISNIEFFDWTLTKTCSLSSTTGTFELRTYITSVLEDWLILFILVWDARNAGHVVTAPSRRTHRTLLQCHYSLLNNQLFTQIVEYVHIKILDKLIKKVINRKFTNGRLVAQWVWHSRQPGTRNQGAFFCFRVESACASEYLEKWEAAYSAFR